MRRALETIMFTGDHVSDMLTDSSIDVYPRDLLFRTAEKT